MTPGTRFPTAQFLVVSTVCSEMTPFKTFQTTIFPPSIHAIVFLPDPSAENLYHPPAFSSFP